MLKTVLTTLTLAGGLAFAGTASAATLYTFDWAGDPAPESVAYECGPYGCGYVPDYYAPAPGTYVVTPGCHWEQGLLGRWKQDCD